MMNGLRCMRRCVSVVTSGRAREISCQAKWKPVCLFGTSALTHANDTVGEIARQWRERFEKEGIPEPIESIEHIIAHIIGTSKVWQSFSQKFVISIFVIVFLRVFNYFCFFADYGFSYS